MTTDQLGRTHQFAKTPSRIISLVPSITELLCDLGQQDFLVGCTSFCIHPKSIKNVCRVGGTKKVDLEKVAALNPDLIIANKEENAERDVTHLMSKYNVWVSDIKNLLDAEEMIVQISAICGVLSRGRQIIDQSRKCLDLVDLNTPRRTLYLIWRKPFMSIGHDTYIHDIMKRCGLLNVCGAMTRYPKLSSEDIRSYAPDLILLSSEPFPFKGKHVHEFEQLLPASKVQLVNGEFFSWYGSRLANLLNRSDLDDIRSLKSI